MREVRHAAGIASRYAAIGSGCAAAFWLLASATPARALHACDPVTDEGWRVTATEEVADIKDGVPYRSGEDWMVDRVTTLLPLCNYFNAVGSYSLRSYSLDPLEKKERVTICRAGMAVQPYTGPCPPK